MVEVDCSRFGAPTYRFHNENIPYTSAELLAAQASGVLAPKTIKFQGEEYGGRPFGIGGIEQTSSGQAGKVTLTVSNMDAQISAIIQAYSGIRQAKVNIYVTLRSLMSEDGTTIEDGDFRKLTYFVDRPKTCDYEKAVFELSSPYDMDGIYIPARISQSVCYWAVRGWYRSGTGCTYNGTNYFDKDGNPVTDPSLDVCPGLVSSCKLRFGANEQLDFGGAAAASLQAKNR